MYTKLNNESITLNAEITLHDNAVIVELFLFPSVVYSNRKIPLFVLADTLYDALEQKKTVLFKIVRGERNGPGELLSFQVLTPNKFITSYKENWAAHWSETLQCKEMHLAKWIHYVLAYELFDFLVECILDTHAYSYRVEVEKDKETEKTRYLVKYRFVEDGVWKEREVEGDLPLTANKLIRSYMDKWLKKKLLLSLKTLRPEQIKVLVETEEWHGRRRARWSLIHSESGVKLYSHGYTTIGPGSRSLVSKILSESEALQSKKMWTSVEVNVSPDLLNRLVKTALKRY